MVVQYPHTLIVTTQSSNAVQDANGNWIQGSNAISEPLPCRAEPNGNRSIVLPDGTQQVFAFMVYLPLNTPDIAIGSKVQLNAGSYQVKQFSRGQLNCRLWL